MDWFDVEKVKSLVLELMMENRELQESLKTWQENATYWHGEYRRVVKEQCAMYCEEIKQEA